MNTETLMSFLLGGGISAMTTHFLNNKIHSPPQSYVSLIASVPLGLIALFFLSNTKDNIKGYLSSYAYVSFVLFLTVYFMFIIYNINPKINIKILTFIALLFWIMAGTFLIWSYTA